MQRPRRASPAPAQLTLLRARHRLPAELDIVMKSLGHDLSDKELEEMIAEVDEDNNGEIDFQEFLVMVS